MLSLALSSRPDAGQLAAVALTATVYRIHLELSDIDRGVYTTLDFRIAQHPSESADRVVARILAYALFYEENLQFGRGISDAEEPDLWEHDLTGQLLHWIEVGTPSAERVHLASKKARRVSIVCHKRADSLAREMAGKRVHNAENITVVYLDPQFVAELAPLLSRSSDWLVLNNEGELSVTVAGQTFAASVPHSALPTDAS